MPQNGNFKLVFGLFKIQYQSKHREYQVFSFAGTVQRLHPPHLLTLAVASIFSGSIRVLSSPINWTAPPSSGSVSQIICSMTTLMRRMSCRKVPNKHTTKQLDIVSIEQSNFHSFCHFLKTNLNETEELRDAFGYRNSVKHNPPHLQSLLVRPPKL